MADLKKPIDTIALAASIVSLVKTATVVFVMMLLEWARLKERRAQVDAAKAKNDLEVAKVNQVLTYGGGVRKRSLIATLSLAASLLAVQARAETTCYNEEQLVALAQAVGELETCRATLALRERFIEEQRLGVPAPEAAWWQEPTVVVGGVVVSLSVGLALGIMIAGNH